MEPLIRELSDEHQIIVNKLQAIYDAGVDNPETRRNLRKLRDYLLGHILREEQEVYEPLRQAAKTDAQLRRLVGETEAENEALTEALLDFFGNHDAEDVSAFHFARDFGSLRIALLARVRKEEQRIFPALSKLLQG